MNERLKAELHHLIWLAESGPAWYEFAMHKAQTMAMTDPIEMNQLPVLLKSAILSRRHGPPRKSIGVK